MVDQASSLGAEIAYLAIGIAIFWAAYRLGMWVSDRTKRILLGWAVGIGFIVLAGIVIGPVLNSLKTEKCKTADDPSLCEEGPGQEY